MAADDYRFSLTAEKYLDKHHILTYVEDAVSQLLEHKDSNPKVNVTKFFSDYFTSIKEGNHVLFRECAFVRATPHNRSSFVRTFWKCFRNIGRKGDLLSVREYHSLLCLLCPDFPFPPVQKTARIILMEDAMDCLISFPDFLYAFQVQFCYDEFLSKCAEMYKELQNNPQVSVDTVVVPTSEENAAPVHTTNKTSKAASTEGVDAMQFYRLLIPVCEKLNTHAPPTTVLREILSAADRVTFYGFLMALAKSETLNKSIGKLPTKAELLDTSDPELTSSPVLAGSDILGRFPTPPPIRPGSGTKIRTASAHLRSVSSSTTNNAPNINTTASTGAMNNKPPTGSSAPSSASQSTPTIKHSHTTSRTTQRRQRRQTVGSTDSDDDDDDDDDSGSSTN